MIVRSLTFSQFHNKRPPTGSTWIRIHQLFKYWKEFDLYQYGENPDVLIFQKVYCNTDYKFPSHFEGLKILDVADPDWFNGKTDIVETIQAMDAVTCPTENLAKFLRQLSDKPVKVIKDRFDMEVIPKPKEHHYNGKTVVWFGYRHNAVTLRPAIDLIEKLKLKLLVIAEDDPLAYNWGSDELRKQYTYKQYTEETIYEDLQKADFAIFPKGTRPEDHFKSENKTVKANLAGLPVAVDEESVRAYIDPKNRQEWLDTNYAKLREQYDVRNSVKEMKELIEQISKKD